MWSFVTTSTLPSMQRRLTVRVFLSMIPTSHWWVNLFTKDIVELQVYNPLQQTLSYKTQPLGMSWQHWDYIRHTEWICDRKSLSCSVHQRKMQQDKENCSEIHVWPSSLWLLRTWIWAKMSIVICCYICAQTLLTWTLLHSGFWHQPSSQLVVDVMKFNLGILVTSIIQANFGPYLTSSILMNRILWKVLFLPANPTNTFTLIGLGIRSDRLVSWANRCMQVLISRNKERSVNSVCMPHWGEVEQLLFYCTMKTPLTSVMVTSNFPKSSDISANTCCLGISMLYNMSWRRQMALLSSSMQLIAQEVGDFLSSL